MALLTHALPDLLGVLVFIHIHTSEHHAQHLVSLVAIGVHASWVGVAPVGMGGEDFTQASCLVSLISKTWVGCPVQHCGTMEWGTCKAWVLLMREIIVAIDMCSHHNGHCTCWMSWWQLGCIVGRHCIHWKRASAGGTGHRPHTQRGELEWPLASAVIAMGIAPHWMSWWQLGCITGGHCTSCARSYGLWLHVQICYMNKQRILGKDWWIWK